MSTIRKLLDNKYVTWLKKGIIDLISKRYYTWIDMLVFFLVCFYDNWLACVIGLGYILLISPIIVAAREDFDKKKTEEQDEHSQL